MFAIGIIVWTFLTLHVILGMLDLNDLGVIISDQNQKRRMLRMNEAPSHSELIGAVAFCDFSYDPIVNFTFYPRHSLQA